MSYCYEQNKCVKVWKGEGCFRSTPGFEEMAVALSTELEDGRTATQVRGKGPKTRFGMLQE